jgi:hypothetical protein
MAIHQFNSDIDFTLIVYKTKSFILQKNVIFLLHRVKNYDRMVLIVRVK